jgi:hypothetical protein
MSRAGLIALIALVSGGAAVPPGEIHAPRALLRSTTATALAAQPAKRRPHVSCASNQDAAGRHLTFSTSFEAGGRAVVADLTGLVDANGHQSSTMVVTLGGAPVLQVTSTSGVKSAALVFRFGSGFHGLSTAELRTDDAHTFNAVLDQQSLAPFTIDASPQSIRRANEGHARRLKVKPATLTILKRVGKAARRCARSTPGPVTTELFDSCDFCNFKCGGLGFACEVGAVGDGAACTSAGGPGLGVACFVVTGAGCQNRTIECGDACDAPGGPCCKVACTPSQNVVGQCCNVDGDVCCGDTVINRDCAPAGSCCHAAAGGSNAVGPFECSASTSPYGETGLGYFCIGDNTADAACCPIINPLLGPNPAGGDVCPDGKTCCGLGHACASDHAGGYTCCDPGDEGCGSTCCPAGQACVVPSPDFPVCCEPSRACGDGCCPAGNICFGHNSATGCCDSLEHVCGDVCCDGGVCLHGNQCCSPATGGLLCGDSCCSLGETCCDGTCCGQNDDCIGLQGSRFCCPKAQECGPFACCAADQLCVDPIHGTCVACAAGKVPCGLTGMTPTCCAPGIQCCGPAGGQATCCQAGEQCCGPGSTLNGQCSPNSVGCPIP